MYKVPQVNGRPRKTELVLVPGQSLHYTVPHAVVLSQDSLNEVKESGHLLAVGWRRKHILFTSVVPSQRSHSSFSEMPSESVGTQEFSNLVTGQPQLPLLLEPGRCFPSLHALLWLLRLPQRAPHPEHCHGPSSSQAVWSWEHLPYRENSWCQILPVPQHFLASVFSSVKQGSVTSSLAPGQGFLKQTC